MSITQNSFFLQLLLALAGFFRHCWTESTLRRALARLQRWFLTRARDSVICRFFWREGTLTRSWPHSLICRLVTVLINVPCAVAKWLYKLGRQVWESSLFCRFLALIGGGTFLFLGLFMAVMLAVPHDFWNNVYGLLAAVALLLLFVVGSASRARSRLEMDRLGPYMLLYMVFIGTALASSLSTHLSMRFFFFHLTGFLLVLLVVSSVHKYEQLQLMVALAVMGLSVAALYGCYQGYVGVEVVPSQQDMILNAGMPGRVYSFFDNPNNFAEQLVMLLPLDLALFLNAGWRGKLLSLFSLCAGVAALGYTYSRSSWIGLALALLVFLFLMDWRLVVPLLLLGIAAIPLLPETIYNRLLTIGNTKDSSLNYRFAIYNASRVLMHDYWFQGVGLGSDVMREAFHNYPTMFDGSYPIHTHSNYLQMWGEVGILGFLSYLGLLLWQLKRGLKSFFFTKDKRVRRMLAAALGGFCGILVIGLAEYTWFYPRNMFTYWFLFGVIGACAKLARQPERSSAE